MDTAELLSSSSEIGGTRVLEDVADTGEAPVNVCGRGVVVQLLDMFRGASL